MRKSKPSRAKLQSRAKPQSPTPEPPSLKRRSVFIYPGRSPAGVTRTHQLFEFYRRRFEAGDREAGLLALLTFHDVFLSPAWLAEMVCRAIYDWLAYRAATLDAAFGVPKRPGAKGKGKRARQRAERERLRPLIVLELVRLQQQENAPMDNRTFERVGNEINKSAAYVSRVYYEVASAGLRKLAPHLRPE